MASVLEIVRGIAQAASNAYDGAHDERFVRKGEDKKVGLKREEGCPINDSRVMDGFGVRMQGDRLILSYHSEISLKDFHSNGYEDDVESTINDIVKFLKKEYKSVTGNALTLTADGETSMHAQSASRVKTWVQATKSFKIGNMGGTEEVSKPSEDRLDNSIKKWLAIGKDQYPGAKKPENVSTKGA